MWMNILTPNPTKYEAWLRRVVTCFKVKVDRARSGGGKAPNLRSGAVRQLNFCTPCVSPKNTDCGPQEQFPIEHSLVPTSIAEGQFRDADPQLVFQCSMLWGTYAGNIKTVVGQETYEQLDGMFARGAFDVPLAAQIKLRDENFKLENLSFMQSYLEGPTEKSETSRMSETDFKLFKFRLQTEETGWSQHLARVKQWHAKDHEAKVDLLRAVHNMRAEKVDEHCSKSYPVMVCGNIKEVRALGCWLYS